MAEQPCDGQAYRPDSEAERDHRVDRGSGAVEPARQHDAGDGERHGHDVEGKVFDGFDLHGGIRGDQARELHAPGPYGGPHAAHPRAGDAERGEQRAFGLAVVALAERVAHEHRSGHAERHGGQKQNGFHPQPRGQPRKGVDPAKGQGGRDDVQDHIAGLP